MNLQQTKLGLVFKSSGITIKLDTFDDRLVLQKAVYLLQESGLELGYRYHWHLRGPYSSGLTEDAYYLDGLSEENSELDEWELDESSITIIERVKEIFQDRQEQNFAKKLELFASTLFLIRTRQVDAESPNRISEILKANDKLFEEEDVQKALTTLHEFGYSLS